MITKKDLITDAQLMADIREPRKAGGMNKGKSAVMAFIETTNNSGRRLRRQWKWHGKNRRAKKQLTPKAIASGSTNGIRKSNARLKVQIESMKSR
ncbi:MAG TPA: hypothetical protein PKD94_06415 [Ignavibacteria bacterium]|nr:hypothetical protein [Ignavibacteria bacterium]